MTGAYLLFFFFKLPFAPSSEDSVVLERCLPTDGSDAPCVLYLHCDPRGREEITCVGVLSEARNMEVYVGEEYCGTSRGEHVCTVQGGRSVALCHGLCFHYLHY